MALEAANAGWAVYELPTAEEGRAEPAAAQGGTGSASVERNHWQSQCHPEPPDDGLLLQNVVWFCSLRWMVVGTLAGLGVLGWATAGQTLPGGIRLSAGWPLTVAAALAALNLSYLDLARRAAKGPARRPAAAKPLAANRPRLGRAHRGGPLRGQPGDVRAVYVPVSHRPGVHLFPLRAKPPGHSLRHGDVFSPASSWSSRGSRRRSRCWRRDRPASAAWGPRWPGISARWCSFPARYGILHPGWPTPCGGGTKNWPRSIAAWWPPPRKGRGT